MKIRTLCVLGGTGFVGRALVQRLAGEGRQARVLTRYRERHRALLVLPTLELVQADVHDPQTLVEHFRGCDAVVNLVGILNEKGHDGRGFWTAHVELARKVVEACRGAGVRRLLHMSALNADATHGPSHYLRTKGEAEDLVHAASDLQVTSFQPSVIFGPGDGFFNRFARLLKLTPGVLPLACPQARFSPVYVGDVAAAFVAALDDRTSAGRRYELCGPRSYTLKQLVQYTARCAGLKRWIVGLSDRLSRLQASVFEYLPGKPFSYDNYLSLQTDSVCRENGLMSLGITPTPVEAVVPGCLGRKAQVRYSHFQRSTRR